MATDEDKKLLEKYRTKLQCFACKVPPGPNERKDRYLCIEKIHPLCIDCKDSCPCQKKPRKPCKNLAKMIDKSPWFHCRYYEEGCRELHKERKYEKHLLNCDYRKVKCFVTDCNQKIFFKEFDKHYIEKHRLADPIFVNDMYGY